MISCCRQAGVNQTVLSLVTISAILGGIGIEDGFCEYPTAPCYSPGNPDAIAHLVGMARHKRLQLLRPFPLDTATSLMSSRYYSGTLTRPAAGTTNPGMLGCESGNDWLLVAA